MPRKERFLFRGATVGATSPRTGGRQGCSTLFGQGNLFAQHVQEELSPEAPPRHEEFLARQRLNTGSAPLYGQGAAFLQRRTSSEQEGQYGHLRRISRETTDVPPALRSTMQHFAPRPICRCGTPITSFTGWRPNETEIQGIAAQSSGKTSATTTVRTVGDLNGKEGNMAHPSRMPTGQKLSLERFENGKNASPTSSRAPCRSLRGDVQRTSLRLSGHSRRRSAGTAASICPYMCPV